MGNRISEQGREGITRRTFLKGSSLLITGAALGYGIVSVPLLRSEELLLRPPGALEEKLFLASCIKCGQCVQVCPPQILKLGGIRHGFAIGTPYLVPRKGACILCEGLPCVLACPTGALSHDLSHGKDAEMGLAVLTHPDTCLAILGINDLVYRFQNLLKSPSLDKDREVLRESLVSLVARLTPKEREKFKTRFSLPDLSEGTISGLAPRIGPTDLEWLLEFTSNTKQANTPCRICLEECPIKQESPIVFVDKKDPKTGKKLLWPMVTKSCVGCGVCEEKCPTPVASIEIFPRRRWSEAKAKSGVGRSG